MGGHARARRASHPLVDEAHSGALIAHAVAPPLSGIPEQAVAYAQMV